MLVGIFAQTQLMGQNYIDLGAAKSAQNCSNITNDGFTATFSFNGIKAIEVATERGLFSSLTMDDTYPAGQYGEPTVPVANKLLAIPYSAQEVTVKVKGYTTNVYSLEEYGIHRLFPLQHSLRKDQKPEDLPFEYNEEAYTHRGFDEKPIAEVAIQGTLRGIKVATLTVNPVQYDAANNSIRVYNDIELEVSYGNYDHEASYQEFARTFSPYFATIYRSMFNWRDDVYDQHPDLWQNPVKMLVITNRMFEDCIQDWVNWKITKGIHMDVNFVEDIGTTASAVRQFIQGKYAEDAPTFVMIMGDTGQVPASANSSSTQCVTDFYYMGMDNDDFPEMFHSRFPAENVQQMSAMLEKALEYEQYSMPDPSYLSNVLLIAGEDSGWGVQVGRPTIWYATNYYYNTDHGFNEVNEFSHGTYTNCYNSLNTGVGFVNYTAHGSNTSWAGPQLTVSNVNALTNEHKYFLAMGNCCEAADWGINGACFGEAMVRAEKKAAYAYIGSCPSTYWLNDYYFGVGATSIANGTMPTYEQTTMGCYDAIWTDNAYNTVSAIPFIGNLASNAAQALGYELHIGTTYCWHAYHVLGDGSILPYRIMPTDNEVSHLPTLPIGVNFYNVTAAPGSFVSITKDGVIYGTGIIDETGSMDVTIEPITSGGDVTICVTHPQHSPYITTVPAAAMNGAYIAYDAYEMSAEQANYGETIDMSIQVKNVGTQAASNLTATLTTENEYVEILAGEGAVTSITPDQTAVMEGFQFAVANNVPDKTKAQFFLTITDGEETWESKFNIELHAPVLSVASVEQSDSEFTLTIANTGSAPFYGGTLNIYSSSNDVVFEQPTITVEDAVEGNNTLVLTSPYTVSENAEAGSTYEVAYEFSTGLFLVSDVYILTYGAIIEDFENGEFGENWTNGQPYGWTIVNEGPDGSLCAKSSNNGINSSEANLTLTVNVLAAGNLTFMYRVSSENNYDKLRFSYDNSEVQNWSGDQQWALYELPVSVGQHTFKWTYSKDYSVNSGSDCAWIDDIKFPPTSVVTFIDPVTNLELTLTGMTATLTWDEASEADSYIIKCNDVTIAEVTETTFSQYFPEAGTYKLSVFAAKDNSLSMPASVIADIIYNDVNESQASQVKVFPNPASSMITIATDAEEYTYQLINSIGQVVESGIVSGSKQINVNNFIKGVYMLRVTTDGQTQVQKVVIE